MYKDICKPDCALLANNIYLTNWKNFTMDYHTHEAGSLEINYVTKGKCEYHIDGEVVKVKAKNLIIINANVPHKLVFTEDEQCLVMGVSCTPYEVKPGLVSLKDMLKAYPELDRNMGFFDTYTLMQDAHQLYPILKDIMDELRENKNDAYSSMLVTQLLVTTARIGMNEDRQVTDYVGKAKTYMSRHYYSIKSVDDIAAAVNLNKSYLEKIFKEETGVSLWNFLTSIRLECAANTLVNTDFTVEQIYESIGVNSRQNFNNMFKKQYKMTPLQYREQNSPGVFVSGRW